MRESCSVPFFSHRKLLILAVPNLWKKCQQRRRGKSSHPAQRNSFLSHIIHSQESLKYNTAMFAFGGLIQLLQHSPWGASPGMFHPSLFWIPTSKRAGSRKWSPSAGRCFPKQYSRFFPYPCSKTLLLFTPPCLGWLGAAESWKSPGMESPQPL